MADAEEKRDESPDPSWAALCRTRWEERARRDARFYTDCVNHADPGRWDAQAEAEAALYLHGIDPIRAAHGRVLEIGCGPGRLLPRLARPFSAAIGIDVARTMLLEARAKIGATPPTLLVHCPGTDLAFLADGSFDLVVMSAAAIHWPLAVIASYAREAHRVLAPGGRLRLTLNRGTHRAQPLPSPEAAPPGVDPLMLGADWCGHVFRDGEPESFFSALGFTIRSVLRLSDAYFGLDAER